MPESAESSLCQRTSGTYLAFDYGQKHLGIAGGQTITGSAGPIKTISVAKGINWYHIEQIVREWKPIGLIIGIPYTADSKRTSHIKRIHRFISDMESHFQLPVFPVDEHLSSYAARDLLSQSAHKKMRTLDDTAAAVILQTWFDSHDDND